MAISDIVSRYKSRHPRRSDLHAALRRHAAILRANDPKEAEELLARAGKSPKRKPASKAKSPARETLDPIRAAWLEHDKRNGLTRD